jgi:uncharacterized DUF497 family protein
MIIMKNLEFDWDEGNIEKILRRFTIIEVEDFFGQTLHVIEDVVHSKIERRLIATGAGPNKRPMFVCFMLRSNKIRVISARFMKAKEAEKYEKFKKDF